MVVKINSREIQLKWSFRSMMLYENIMKKSFTPENTTDVLVFMYCVILSSVKDDFELKFDDFLDFIDTNPYILVDFGDWFTKEMDKANSISPDSDEDEDNEEGGSKKKLKRKNR